ncbi:transmembrane protein 151B-like isoform X3 [Varroa jacobsoni]|uniref:transmembrane protein 151B-like isoform X3 n=1 Tax=Varroa jacobsoni TaxID=62625 RepID=UPI000BF58AD1|nr:transmembrane protein 151B-like isoform X3 [Varroa jacobsoni]
MENLSAPAPNVVIEENEEVRPQRRKLAQCLREDAHFRCLLLTLIQLACLTAIAWCRLWVVKRYVIDYKQIPIRRQVLASPCGEAQVYLPLAVFALAYIAYLIECYHCATRLQLLYKVSSSAVYAYMNQMREAQPIIWWKATCYHYVRRNRQVIRYRNGEAYATSQTYYERVNTHTCGSCFSYQGVRDISKRLVGLEEHPTTKIRLGKGFAFASVASAQDFEEQRARFFGEQGRLDDYVEMREGLDLAGCNFEEYIVAFADRLPWYVSQTGFWLLSLALLSWPLRLFIEYRTAHVHVQLTKLFGDPHQPLLSSASNPSMTTCLNSPDTIDNPTLEPMSYSEALLYPDLSELAGRVDLTQATNLVNNLGGNNHVTAHDLQEADTQSNVKSNSLGGRRSWGGYPSPTASSHQILYYELPSPPSYLDAISSDGVPLAPPLNGSGGSLTTGAFGLLRRSITDRDLVSRIFSSSSLLDDVTRSHHWSPETPL